MPECGKIEHSKQPDLCTSSIPFGQNATHLLVRRGGGGVTSLPPDSITTAAGTHSYAPPWMSRRYSSSLAFSPIAAAAPSTSADEPVATMLMGGGAQTLVLSALRNVAQQALQGLAIAYAWSRGMAAVV